MAKTSLAKRIKNYELRIKGFIRKNPKEVILLTVILLVGAFFRLYKIDQYMTFLGDEGRDVIVVRRLLVDFDPILVGPGTSIGNMYLGPVYYYMMAPALLLANFSPVGPAIMVALLGVLSIFFVWYVAREWFGKLAAIIAALLYAIAPVVIVYSRSSWNPNIMPFFALLTVYGIWRTWQKYQWKWLVISMFSFAITLQSHYLGLLLTPVIGLFWLIMFIRLRVTRYVLNLLSNNKPATRNTLTGEQMKQIKNFLKYSLISTTIFALLMSPLVIFDARHGWMNFAAMKKFFTQRQTTVSARPWNAIPKAWPLANKISTSLITAGDESAGRFIILSLVFLFIYILINKKTLSEKEKMAYFLILVWLGFAFLGLGLYKQEIYDHYFGFFFPAPFLLIGGFFDWISKKEQLLGIAFAIWMMVFLVIINLRNNPLKYSANRQLHRTKEVAGKVIELSGGDAFNFAVLAERNYEGAYMYFFEMWNIPAMVPIADKLDETLADQLFVVCELPRQKCRPEASDRPEITNFGWLEKVADWEYQGVVIFKYIHPG